MKTKSIARLTFSRDQAVMVEQYFLAEKVRLSDQIRENPEQLENLVPKLQVILDAISKVETELGKF